MRFYADITSQIDIIIDQKPIQYTFLIPPFCKFNSHDQKHEFLLQLDRTNPHTICESLLHLSGNLIYTMKARHWVKNKNRFIGKMVFKYDTMWEELFV